jgi:hypothetical protein
VEHQSVWFAAASGLESKTEADFDIWLGRPDMHDLHLRELLLVFMHRTTATVYVVVNCFWYRPAGCDLRALRATRPAGFDLRALFLWFHVQDYNLSFRRRCFALARLLPQPAPLRFSNATL